MEVATRSTGALSMSGMPTGVFSFFATTRFSAKLDAKFQPKFGYKLPRICHNRGPKYGVLPRSMCSVALEEAKLEETGFQLEIPQFKVIQVPPVQRTEFYMGSVLVSEDVASGIRCMVIETEISRELVHRGDAYTKPGQLAQVRMKGGEVLRVPVSSAPFSKETNSSVLYKMRGDRPAGHIKAPNSTLSIKAPLHLHVTQSDYPLLYELKKGDEVEVGPFEPTGLDLRPVLFISGFPTMLFFASGRGIAVVRAIIEAKEGDKGSLSLGFREEVRLYYSAPDPTLIAYKVHADSESSSNAQNIQTIPKRRKLLSGETYCKGHLVDGNGQPLHLSNSNIASSSHNPGTMMDSSDDERPTYYLPLHLTTMSNREKVELREKLVEERYQEWLNQPPIQFPLRPDSLIRNDYNNSSSSEAGNGDNQIEFGMDDYLRDTNTMETMLLDAFRNDGQLGDYAHIADIFFESLKFASTTPLFGPDDQSKST